MKSVTIEDVCKKDFEVFCDLWGYDKTIDENGLYSSSLTDRLFTSFCAGWRDSRKALVVELPTAWNASYTDKAIVMDADSIEDATKLMGAIKDTITIVESTELHDKVMKALEALAGNS